MKTKKIEDCNLAVSQSSAPVDVSSGAIDIHNIAQLENEIQDKFTPKKYQNMQLASDYYFLASIESRFVKRIDRVSQCGNELRFGLDDQDKFRLIAANFCRDLMCPQCNWRRSLRMFGEVSACMDFMTAEYDFIFATFTIKNCKGDMLSKTCDILQSSFSRMMRGKKVKSIVLGSFSALEITYNKSTEEYHPHMHCIFAVDNSYFAGRHNWISYQQWSLIWQNALKVDYNPVVYVSRVKGNIDKAVAEVAKYSVKGSHYLGNPIVLRTLFDALSNRKKCSFRGVFRDAHRKIGLGDEVHDELIYTDPLKVRDDVYRAFINCRWNGFGYDFLY